MAFFEFNIAMSGLFAAQRGLSVTSNNISNANTTGYSRQVLGQQASVPLKGMGVGMLGTGVNTTSISRMRNSYLDTKLWGQNDKLGEYKIKVEQNSIIETVYGEPSDVGFTKIFNDFFKGIDDLSKLPDESERKAALKQQMTNYTKYFNNISTSLSGFQQDLNYELKSKVDEINLLGGKIQSLNSQIYQAEIYGDDANAFRDERELCVDRLSELVNITTKEEEVEVDGKKYNQFSVKIAGQTLVDHLFIRELGIEVRGSTQTQINNLAAEVAALNTKIAGLTDAAEIAAAEAERDKKALAMKGLDNKITINPATTPAPPAPPTPYNITYPGASGTLTLVDGTTTPHKLELYKLNDEDAEGLYDVIWKDGLPFDMEDNLMSGELKGVIDMRDGCGMGNEAGNDISYNGIPYYIKRMDDYVRTFAMTMNEEYSRNADGYIELEDKDPLTAGLFMKRNDNGDPIYYDRDTVTGVYSPTTRTVAQIATYQHKYQLFTYSNGNSAGTPVGDTELNLTGGYKNMTSANLSISNDIYENAGNIRTNYEHYPEDGTNPNPNNNDLLARLAAQKNNKGMFKEGDPKDYMVAIFSELGINAQEASMYKNTQSSITNNIKSQRLAVSQVDTNEEFTSLIKYQQAYQASAKIMNIIDSIYETTIFKLGNF